MADLMPTELRGTYNAILGALDFPASAIAGVLWRGLGGWQGFDPSAPFIFGGILARLAALLLGVTGIGRASHPRL